ncbi:hypothetical protein [Micromonospora chersina]|uniref:hypothetical protein n=1 Tax=Micromonospora chersina TaxID=47854 RepID=UPI00371F05F6
MRSDEELPDLMVGGDLLTGHPPADRPRRHGRVTLTVAAAAIGLALVGSFLLRQQRATDPVAPRQVSARETPAEPPSTLAWLSALVARDGTSVTVYAGTNAECEELVQPQAAVVEQDGTRVVIAVKARTGRASDCTTSGSVIPLVVPLPEPLGDRVLRDAVSALPPPTYFERDLPGLSGDKRWSPHPGQWSSMKTAGSRATTVPVARIFSRLRVARPKRIDPPPSGPSRSAPARVSSPVGRKAHGPCGGRSGR